METNLDLTKEHKDKYISDKYNFLFNSGSVNCRQSVKFEEFDGFYTKIIIININMKNKE